MAGRIDGETRITKESEQVIRPKGVAGTEARVDAVIMD